MNHLRSSLFVIFSYAVVSIAAVQPHPSPADNSKTVSPDRQKTPPVQRIKTSADIKKELEYWRDLISKAQKSLNQWKKEWDLYDRDLASVKAGKADADIFELRWISSGRKKKLLAGLKPYLDGQKTVRAAFPTDKELHAYMDKLEALEKSVSEAVKNGDLKGAEKLIQDADLVSRIPKK